MENGEAFARMSYWNRVRQGIIQRCTHEAEDGSLICNACWESFSKSLSVNT